MNMIEHLKARRTVRRFKPDEIPQHVLDAVFEAGMWAPSHANTQPWDFLVVGPETRAGLLKIYQAKAAELLADPELPPKKRDSIVALQENFGGAPVLVAVVSRAPDEELQRIENPLSTAAAVQNMCLAAWDAGAGAVWLSLGAAPPARSLLGVKAEQSVVALLAMGYPAEVPPPPPRDPFSEHLRRLP